VLLKFCVLLTFLLRASDYKFYIRSSFALLSWILSRVLGASVGFCVGGFNSVKDVELKFKKVLFFTFIHFHTSYFLVTKFTGHVIISQLLELIKFTHYSLNFITEIGVFCIT